MTTKTQPKSRILETVHETASDLHRLGSIDKRKMLKFDELCLVPVQGPGKPADEAFDRLEAKYAAKNASTFAP